jgi:hypothetical protein
MRPVKIAFEAIDDIFDRYVTIHRSQSVVEVHWLVQVASQPVGAQAVEAIREWLDFRE